MSEQEEFSVPPVEVRKSTDGSYTLRIKDWDTYADLLIAYANYSEFWEALWNLYSVCADRGLDEDYPDLSEAMKKAITVLETRLNH